MGSIESDAARKVEFENMARAYLRLAEQAKRNSLTDIVYETPRKKIVIKHSCQPRAYCSSHFTRLLQIFRNRSHRYPDVRSCLH